jgi:hypothetical protein
MKNLDRNLTVQELIELGFTESNKELPRCGALLLLHHQLWGLTVGFYAGVDCAFILPFVKEYNWATHWKYHS